MQDDAIHKVTVNLTDRRLVYRLMQVLDQDPALHRVLHEAISRGLQEGDRQYVTHQWSANWQPDFLVLNFQFDLYPQREFFPNLTKIMQAVHETL
jgi:hypothetical protein